MSQSPKKLTAVDIRNRKSGEKIVTITAYDYTFARLVDPLVDVVLVGDSLGMVMQGYANTLSVTVDHMIYHSRAVAHGLSKAHLVVDMPFMSFQASSRSALKNAGRLVGEGFAEAVKVEGGVRIARTVEKLVEAGIPVMGHIGLTPQSVNQFGGFKVQGKTDPAREALLADAKALESAGAYSIVLEGMPAGLAREITEAISIPTIGIGAGKDCDGQVLVLQDLLGMNPSFQPRFVKAYASLAGTVQEAVGEYAREVRDARFPTEKHSF